MVKRRTIPKGNIAQFLLEQAVDTIADNLFQKLDITMRQRLGLPPGIGDVKAHASLNRSELQLEQIRRRFIQR